jgi:hypothetical protein
VRAILAIIVVVTSVALTGCEIFRDISSERYSRNNSKGSGWLSDQMLPPEADVSGTWQSADWGKSFLSQNGRTVRGYIGDYQVEGVVSGTKAYLVLSQGSWQYYSVILERPAPNLLIGYYSRSIPYQSNNRSDMRLDLLP